MKTVLITGSQGFIGSYLKKSLQDDYYTIGFSRQEGFDISDFQSLKKIDRKIDIIIHSAATMSNNFEESFLVNALGTLNICKYAKKNQVKHLILISSLSIFDTPDNEYFNNYSKTKKESELIASSYCEDNNIKLSILRLAQVYDDQRIAQKNQQMLYYFIDTIKEQSKISLFGKKNPIRNYIHIEYVASVIKEVLQQSKTGTWNILEEKNHSISEIAYMLFDILKKQPNITYLQDKANIPSVHIPNTNIYKSTTISSISLYEGLKRILNHDK